MTWIILRTDHSKEAYVARQIEGMGFEAWVPTEKRFIRICRHSKQRKITEHPLLPKRIFADLPEAQYGDCLRIRHVVAMERDGAQNPIIIPTAQITRFWCEVDRINRATLALATKPTRKDKARWKSLKDALAEMIEGGKQVVEEAA